MVRFIFLKMFDIVENQISYVVFNIGEKCNVIFVKLTINGKNFIKIFRDFSLFLTKQLISFN